MILRPDRSGGRGEPSRGKCLETISVVGQGAVRGGWDVSGYPLLAGCGVIGKAPRPYAGGGWRAGWCHLITLPLITYSARPGRPAATLPPLPPSSSRPGCRESRCKIIPEMLLPFHADAVRSAKVQTCPPDTARGFSPQARTLLLAGGLFADTFYLGDRKGGIARGVPDHRCPVLDHKRMNRLYDKMIIQLVEVPFS